METLEKSVLRCRICRKEIRPGDLACHACGAVVDKRKAPVAPQFHSHELRDAWLRFGFALLIASVLTAVVVLSWRAFTD